jgi:hypothetical protein
LGADRGREEVKLDWRNLWCSPNIIRVSKPSVRWRGKRHVWGTELRTGIGGKPAGRIMLKWVSKKSEHRVWTGLIWLRVGASDGLLWAR